MSKALFLPQRGDSPQMCLPFDAAGFVVFQKKRKPTKQTGKKTTVCLTCRPFHSVRQQRVIISKAEFVEVLTELGKIVERDCKRLIGGVLEEIQNEDEIAPAHSAYQAIVFAVRRGFQLKSEIERATGIPADKLEHYLSLMVAAKQLEIIEQGGKTETARGQRKKLYAVVDETIAGSIMQLHDLP